MKKRLITFITVILSFIMSLSVSACNLVTSNTERDFNQVVATVEVNQGKKENIYKKDLIMGYLNYGYMYVQYYGYDYATAYKFVLNNLIDNRIVVQVAYDKFENGDAELGVAKRVKNESEAAFTPARYLTADEIIEAKYATYKSINDLLNNYKENDEKEKQDAFI